MPFFRDIFSGQLEEREYTEPGVIARTSVPEFAVQPRSKRSPWYKENKCRPMSIPAEQATPERIERENAEAKRHGTGAMYDPDGECWVSSRAGRSREMRRRGMQDNDAGFLDYAGR